MSTLNISITDDMRDAIRLALIEGEQSGESSLTIDDIIEIEFPSFQVKP